MSSSRPWSKHHAGPLLGGIFLKFFYNFFIIFFEIIVSKVDASTLPMIPATLFVQNRTWVTTTLIQQYVSVKLKTLGTETFTFHVWSTWKHTWCTQEPLAASEMGGWVLYGCSLRWWVVMGVYLSCQGGSCGNSCIGCGAVGMKYVNKWIWAFFFTKRPIFFLY